MRFRVNHTAVFCEGLINIFGSDINIGMSMTFQLPRKASSEDPLRLAILISGSGSGMAALLKHQQINSGLSHITTVVISNKEGVGGLQKAEDGGVEAITICSRTTPEREEHERLIHTALVERNIEAVILSGYMRLFTSWFVEQWEGRMLNIHPSLLPDFPGAHAHRDVIAAGASITGCTVHFVDSGMDSGVIISQREVPVHAGDDEKTLQERVKKIEHLLYPEVIDSFAEGRLDIVL